MADTSGTNLTLTPPRQMAVVETAASAMAQQAAAIIQARYIMAERHPRDIDEVREKLLKECRRPSFCEVAIYNKPIGKGIEGPSIRFAEAAIRCMTNLVIETVSLYDDEQKRIVQVSVTDVEANVPYSQSVTVVKTVERNSKKADDVVLGQRTNSYGKPVYILQANDDEILNKQNALISKAIRTLGLRLVPGDIIDECMDLVKKTLAKKDSEDPDAAKRKLFDSFAALGVSVANIKLWLGHEGSTLTPKELADLRGLYTALRDGETTWREIMDLKGGDSPESDPSDPAVGTEGAKKFLSAWRAANKTTEDVKLYLKDKLGITDSRMIPSSKLDDAIAWASGKQETPDTAPAQEPPVLLRVLARDLMTKLQWPPLDQERALNENADNLESFVRDLEGAV